MSVYCKKRKDGTKAWYYDFTLDGVRYRGVGGSNRTMALRSQEKVRSKVLSGEYELEGRTGSRKIEDFAGLYLKRRKYLKSRKRDDLSVRTLLAFFWGKILRVIHAGDIAKRLLDGVANGTVNRDPACLKRRYNPAIKWKEAKHNPVNDVDFLREPPGRTRFLDPEEVEKLLQKAADHLRPIIFTALNTGMRKNEILTLNWNQVHIENVIDPYI